MLQTRSIKAQISPEISKYRCEACSGSAIACPDCQWRYMCDLPHVNIRKNIARNLQRTDYPDDCPTHGPFVKFATRSGKCLQCSSMKRVTPRTLAREANLPTYLDTCAIHGETGFGVNTGRCFTCFTSSGTPRRTEVGSRKKSPRSLARQLGEYEYSEICAVHGEHAHHVNTGRCLGCYTSNGMKRARAADNPRVAARRAGETIYTSSCQVHGEHAHHVNTGLCLGCYTSAGAPRVGPYEPDKRTEAVTLLTALGFTADDLRAILK